MQYTTNSLESHWMPFTANRDFKADPRLVVKGEGMHYTNHNGGRVIDGSSGLFCCAAGHGRQEIADAVAKQLMEIDYSPHFQIGSPPSFELASRVAALTPDEINHVFFTNSGSESIDTALKIAMAYHSARGEGHRSRFISRERAYHGVNIGGTSLSGLMKNREIFGSVMPGIAHMRHTWTPEARFGRGQPEHGAEMAEDLERFAQLLGGRNIAACFVEPVAGSTGCLVPPKGYLERLREICDTHGILLVFDEVITGFGRLGKPFAAQEFGVTPDIMTMAKALTNGVLPMGAVAVRDEIYDTVVDAAPDGAVEFFHGYTYSGNPASCAAGLATLDIYENDGLFDKSAAMSEYFLDMIYDMQDLDKVTDIRGYGMLAGIDISTGEAPGIAGTRAMKKIFASGLHVKFTGDCALVAPPFIAQKSDIDEIGGILRDVLANL
ncbi:MAG: aspartate aminotransferase family protein [Rhodospirillaceae bacterium]|nr:aspartate aminotransferase family protein [Rhodospirillaceae bacterium]MBT5243464.1 aspartate aminotransferase family protein [Rhodospirillaceae bacterium]MBT5562052.1 aspartate aminotransferase family protein [Rhodospirillaceae bacterium]MBT6242225.1 aspartate aminotransferase family protein [Rhodospirillaceae bacterium]MBT7136257.1 aspartate aminotransferase family protein [Rhodospirillaceae bacterium]